MNKWVFAPFIQAPIFAVQKLLQYYKIRNYWKLITAIYSLYSVRLYVFKHFTDK